MLALLVGDLARLQCQLGIAHTLQHVAQTHRAGNGRRLEHIPGSEQPRLDFLSDEKRLFVMVFPSLVFSSSLPALGISTALFVYTKLPLHSH